MIMFRNKKSRASFSAHLLFPLLCLLILCGASTGIVYAKFIARDALSDKARTARFAITASEGEAQPQSYRFRVTNRNEQYVSEVSITFDVIVSFPEGLALPEDVNMILSCDERPVKSPRMESRLGKTVYIFEEADFFSAGMEREIQCCLKFSAAQTIPETLTFYGITVEVIARQIN